MGTMLYCMINNNNPWFAPMTPQKPTPSGGQSSNVQAGLTPSLADIYAQLVAATNRIAQLEAQVHRLEGALHVSNSGNVEIHSTGGLKILAGGQLTLEGGQQGVVVKNMAGESLTFSPGTLTLKASAKISLQCAALDLTASTIKADAAMSNFSGVVKCQTIIAHSVVGSSYTPGAGNIW